MKVLYKALADFQQEVPSIYKNADGYNYKFADLGKINDIIKPLLKKHGLGYIQPLDDNKVKTIVFHVESGESVESTVAIPQGVELKGQNDFQVMGSAITYLRRYSLSSLLGLITDEDADAAGEQTSTKPTVWKPSDTEPASAKQKAFIKNLLLQHGIETDRMATYLADEFGVLPETGMSQKDAQMIIETLDTRGKEE